MVYLLPFWKGMWQAAKKATMMKATHQRQPLKASSGVPVSLSTPEPSAYTLRVWYSLPPVTVDEIIVGERDAEEGEERDDYGEDGDLLELAVDGPRGERGEDDALDDAAGGAIRERPCWCPSVEPAQLQMNGMRPSKMQG